MQKKQKINLIILGAVIVVLVVVILLLPHANTGSPVQSGNSSAPAGQGSISQSATVAPVPANITVPNEGDKNVGIGIAAPQIQVPAHPSGGDASYRQFIVTANNDTFTPATAIVKKGDIIDLEITAVDKDYDFTQPDYGFSALPVPKGKTTKVQFQGLNSGKFTFYCASCGGPNKGPIGYIIITD